MNWFIYVYPRWIFIQIFNGSVNGSEKNANLGWTCLKHVKGKCRSWSSSVYILTILLKLTLYPYILLRIYVSIETRGTKDPVAVPWVPWLKNIYHGSRRLSTCLGSKTLNTCLGLGETEIKYLVAGATWAGFPPPARCLQVWRTCTFLSPQFPIMAKLGIKSFACTPGASGLILMLSFWCI